MLKWWKQPKHSTLNLKPAFLVNCVNLYQPFQLYQLVFLVNRLSQYLSTLLTCIFLSTRQLVNRLTCKPLSTLSTFSTLSTCIPRQLVNLHKVSTNQLITRYCSKENVRKLLSPTIQQRVSTFYTASKVPIPGWMGNWCIWYWYCRCFHILINANVKMGWMTAGQNRYAFILFL